jgi:hypothetical protein
MHMMHGGAVGLTDRSDLTWYSRRVDDKETACRRASHIVFDESHEGILHPGPPIGLIQFLAGPLQSSTLLFDIWQLFAN